MKDYVERLQLVETGLEAIRIELQVLHVVPEARLCLIEIESLIGSLALLQRSWAELVEEEKARAENRSTIH
jgi:hypothetical protein